MTPELRAKRAGKMTASRAAVLMGGLETSGLDGYIRDLAWERVHGLIEDESYQSAAMLRGKEIEGEALSWYAFATDSVLDVDPDRTIDHPTVPFVAATPDALLPDRVVEVKCPLHREWMECKRRMKPPSQYLHQARWQMWCAGVELCDFVIYHPKVGGLILPFRVTPEECAFMAERAAWVNRRVNDWIDVLQR